MSTDTSDEYDKLAGVELDGLTRSKAAGIVRALDCSNVTAMVDDDEKDGIRVDLERHGGYFAFQRPSSRYVIKSVVGSGGSGEAGETVTLWVKRRQY